MAKTITFTTPVQPPSSAYQELTGRKRTRKLMTLATDATTGTNTYLSGGVPFTQTTAEELARVFDMAQVQELMILEPLTQASFAGDSHIGKIDLTNLKLVLIGGDANSATVAALKEIPNATALGDSNTWTALVEAVGL